MLDSTLIYFLPLVIIPIVYFGIALTKPSIQSRLPFNLCAICAAVSSTWIFLLALWLAGVAVPGAVLGLLMGMSIVGIMYKAEKLYAKRNIRNFWFVRLVIIIGGFYLVLAILEKDWTFLSFLVIIVAFGIAVPSLLMQGITHEDVLEEQKKAGRKDSLIKKLDNCC